MVTNNQKRNYKYDGEWTKILFVLLIFLVSGCQAEANEALVDGPPSDAEITLTPLSEEIAEESNEEDTASTAEAVADECLVCHTDEQALKDSADPVADIESTRIWSTGFRQSP